MDPITRQEQYLNAIAGGDNDVPATPRTREEWFLNQILENGGGQVDPEAIAEAVADWLDDHVDPETGYVIDNSLSVEGAAADAKAAGDEIADLKSAINDIEDVVYFKSTNLYNPALQTSETISPHYYYNGAPYSTTQFDSAYNCTALIPIEPSTTYTIALVPAMNDYTLPWRTSAQGMFFYTADGTYISGQKLNTFTTPSNAAFIRFNYALDNYNSWNLASLNSHCMIVKGENIPAEYSSYYNNTIADMVATKISKPLWYKRTGTTIEVGYSYGGGKDAIVTLKQYGGNNLMDIYQVETIAKGTDWETAERTSVYGNSSDGFSPYVVAAVNDIDGDNPNSQRFSGGAHQYNNQGSGSTATARTVSVSVYADGVTVSDGDKGYAAHLHVEWENRVQAYNTEKSDGTGREVLKVIHTADFDGVDIKVGTNIYPLEDVKMFVFYGFQSMLSSNYPKVRYLNSTNRLVNTIESSSSSSNSGDLVGYSYHAEDAEASRMLEVSIDPLFDLGRRDYATGQPAMFVSSNKGYFSIVRNETSMAKDTLYALKGAYRFYVD